MQLPHRTPQADGNDSEAVESASASECVPEVLRLSDLLKKRCESGQLFNVNSGIFATERAHESEPWVILEVSEFVKERLAAVGIGTENREISGL
jgi:hypothetical protein